MEGRTPGALAASPKDGEGRTGRHATSARLDAIAAQAVASLTPADTEVADHEATRAALDRIYKRLSGVDLSALPEADVREEIGKLIALLPDLPSLRNPFVIQEAEAGAASIAADGRTDASFARIIRQDLERRLAKARRDQVNPAIWLVAGLGIAVMVLPVIVLLVLAQLDPGGLFFKYGNTLADVSALFWVVIAIAGALGGAVSVLQRVTTFKEVRGDRAVLVITGFGKPLIGGIFAMFVFALLVGGLIAPLDSLPNPSAVSLAIAFLAGFSERLVPDLTGTLERTYVTKVKVS